MPKYIVHVNTTFEVEADDKEQAFDIAADLLEYSIENELDKIAVIVEKPDA